MFVWLRGCCSVVSGLSGATLAEWAGGKRPEAWFMVVWAGEAVCDTPSIHILGVRVLITAPELALM